MNPMTGPAPRAIVFDLDGTLVDSAPGIAAALRMLDRARRPIRVERVRALVALGAEALIRETFDLPDAAMPEARAAFRAVYAADPCRPADLYPGARDALAACRRRGLRIGVCTNKPQRLAEIALDRLGLAALVDVVVGAAPERPEKPAPDMLLHACARLGTDAALFVGDTAIDAETAARAGLPFVAATFGYGSDLGDHPHAATLAAFSELAGVLDAWMVPAKASAKASASASAKASA